MIITEEAYLEHFGVKGMRWGVSRANRGMNKASRARDRATIDKQIDKARARTEGTSRLARLGIGDKGSKSHTEFKGAKAKYHQQKYDIGTREARKALSKARDKRVNDLEFANLAKSGRETTFAVLGLVGSTLLRPV
jgi:hypothetical protein